MKLYNALVFRNQAYIQLCNPATGGCLWPSMGGSCLPTIRALITYWSTSLSQGSCFSVSWPVVAVGMKWFEDKKFPPPPPPYSSHVLFMHRYFLFPCTFSVGLNPCKISLLFMNKVSCTHKVLIILYQCITVLWNTDVIFTFSKACFRILPWLMDLCA